MDKEDILDMCNGLNMGMATLNMMLIGLTTMMSTGALEEFYESLDEKDRDMVTKVDAGIDELVDEFMEFIDEMNHKVVDLRTLLEGADNA